MTLETQNCITLNEKEFHKSHKYLISSHNNSVSFKSLMSPLMARILICGRCKKIDGQVS